MELVLGDAFERFMIDLHFNIRFLPSNASCDIKIFSSSFLLHFIIKNERKFFPHHCSISVPLIEKKMQIGKFSLYEKKNILSKMILISLLRNKDRLLSFI